MSTAEDSFFISPSDAELDHADVDSLPSETTDESSNYYSDAEKEWRESLQQLELLLTMIVVPYLGRYFGRRCAYWSWARIMEWKYPVEVQITDPTLFKATGAIEAAATL